MNALALIALLAADIPFGQPPPIRTCDDAAYLLEKPVMPPPLPPFRVAWRDFVGPRPLNAPLPAIGRAGDTYAEHLRRFQAQPMRRRSQ